MPWPRILLALFFAALTTVVALPGRPRRRIAGWLFFVVVCTGVVKYGDAIGLRSAGDRWLAGIVLSSPFIYLLFESGSGLRMNRRER